MASEVRFNQIFNYWWEDLKWSGVFDVNWVYIKDVHHADVRGITYQNTPIPSLKDGNEIDFAAGKALLEAFRTYPLVSNIFEAFEYMDERENILRIKRDSYYELFKKLNEKGLIEDTKAEKGGDRRSGKPEPKSQRSDHKSGRGKHRGNGGEMYYEKKEQ
jgi:hypothetical protein